jgi:hypothetical protein
VIPRLLAGTVDEVQEVHLLTDGLVAVTAALALRSREAVDRKMRGFAVCLP